MGFLANLFGPKGRLDDEKADQLRTEVRALSDRLGTTEIGLMRVLDDKFDADTYRQALVVTYKEHVYGNLWKTLSAAIVVIGLGFSAGTSVWIQNRVDAGIQQRVDDLDSLANRMQGTFVQGLLAEVNKSRNVQASEYLIKQYRPVIETLIHDPLDSLRFIQTADFVAWSENDRLVEALERVARNDTVDAAFRGPAFKALLRRAPGNLTMMAALAAAADKVDDGYHNYLAVLAAQHTGADRMTEVMDKALASGETAAVKSALRFFATNPGQCGATCATHVQRHASSFKQLASIITIGDPASLPAEKADQLEHSVLTFLDSDDWTMEEKAPVAERASIRLLRQGKRNVYNDLYARGFRYSHSVWVDSVASLFDGFLAETRSHFNGRALESLRDPGEQQEAWDALYYTEGGYAWRGTGYERNTTLDGAYDIASQQTSVADLRNRDFNAYLNIMSSSYYASEFWTEEIRPLFPDFVGSGEPGSNDMQDDLWYWVEDNLERLFWDEESNYYTLREQ